MGFTPNCVPALNIGRRVIHYNGFFSATEQEGN